jgi:hypothetical protein
MRKTLLLLTFAATACGGGGMQVATGSGGTYASGYTYDDGAYASVSVSSTPFYEDLSPYGQWIQDPSYGAVFIPASRSYTPYTNGYWAYTQYGPTWVSYEPFGWATEHYGRWVQSPRYGWAWIPGTEWSPAWVEFRYDSDYLAWAPLGPSGTVYASWRYAPSHRFFDRDYYRGDYWRSGVTVREHDRYRNMHSTRRLDRNFFTQRNVTVTPRNDVPLRRLDNVRRNNPYTYGTQPTAEPRERQIEQRRLEQQRQLRMEQQRRIDDRRHNQAFERQPERQPQRKPDKAERKIEKHERNIDRHERKIDNQERKIERQERKIDKQERKPQKKQQKREHRY